MTTTGSGRARATRAAARSARAKRPPGPPDEPAPLLPVGRVAVDVPLPHLDRPFDYLVPARLDAQAVPGARVRVRFAGQLVDGFLLERTESSDHPGRLAPLAKVVSPEPVLTPEVYRLARAVADRYAGTLADVLRLAVPPRHATAEAEPRPPVEPTAIARPDPGPWQAYPAGSELLASLADGRSPRVVWGALPGRAWPTALARLAAAAAGSSRGSLLVVPDQRDLGALDEAVTELLGPGRHVVLTAEVGPKERYRRWLRVLRGEAGIVIGTRAAAFAPVRALGLAVVWDDGDDLHAEPRAPSPHVREVLALRAHQAGAGLLIGGYSRTAEAASLVSSGYARSLVAARTTIRAVAPRTVATDDGPGRDSDPLARQARLPSLAWRTARDALRTGPVLVQVPRAGYLPAVACARCRTHAHCDVCHGPLALPDAGAAPRCGWCGRPSGAWHCPECGHGRLRASVVGARRTAEELGRAFAGVPVVTSGAATGVLATVAERPALVVATPGAEPVAPGGYAAALLLDAWALLDRADLRAGEETLRRWLAAAALVRPAGDGGRVVVVADAALRPVQALVRWDPPGFAERELADRIAAGLPPAVRAATLQGSIGAVADLLSRARLPAGAEVLGPAPIHAGGGEPGVRALIRVPRHDGGALATALRAAAGERAVRKEPDPVTVRIDPVDLG